MTLNDAVVVSDYFDVSMDNLYNPKALNSKEFMKIAQRYFNNDKISIEERNEVLKDLFRFKTDGEIKELFDESK